MASLPTMAEAVRHYDRGDRAAARAACEQILASGSKNNDARLLLAILLIEDGDAARGLSLLELIVASAPNNARARHALGKALARVGRCEEAVGHLEQVIAQQPANIDAYLDLGAIHLRCDEAAAAERVLRHAIATAPQTPAAHYNLAMALEIIGDIEQAIAEYREAVALKPDYVDGWHSLGNALLDLGRVAEAADAFESGTQVRRRPGAPQASDGFARMNPGKLRHDIEQLRYLSEHGRIGADRGEVVAAYEAALAALPANATGPTANLLPAELRRRLAPYYNRLLYRPPAEREAGGAVNAQLDAAAIEADYRRGAPGITFFDGLLTGAALESLRRFCLEATIWHESRDTNGCLRACFDDGFCCPLLLQIAEELRRALPGIFGHHALRNLWACKYDSRPGGVPIHADLAAVNVNFWVTSDDANLDPDSGGLIVWDKKAPLDWDFARHDNDQVAALRRFLAESRARPTTVPHRQNRVVIFDADLPHETAPLKFRDGYENRPLSITMLYGKRAG